MKSFKRLAATAMLSSVPFWALGCAAKTDGPPSTGETTGIAASLLSASCRVTMQPGPMIFSTSMRLQHEEAFKERNPGWELDSAPLISLPQHLSWSMTGSLVSPTGASGISFEVESQDHPEKVYSTAYIGKDGVREWSDAVQGQAAQGLEQTFTQTSCPQVASQLDGAWNGMLGTYAQAIQAHLSAYARVRIQAFLKRDGVWQARLYEFQISAVQVHCFRPGGPRQLLDLGTRGEKSGRMDLGSPWDTLGCRALMEVDLARGVGYEEVAL